MQEDNLFEGMEDNLQTPSNTDTSVKDVADDSLLS